ncbi:MAG: acetate--CoA ligase [Planctomycetes bacterium]|nr:acetate--CoA ligase [Planctomycetota bacterium]
MLFALLGKYDPLKITEVHAKENEVLANPPLGLKIIGRYSMVGKKGGFIDIVEADSAEQLAALTLKFAGLAEFEITPLVETIGGKAKTLIGKHLGEIMPMHGPIPSVPQLYEPEIVSVMDEKRKFKPPAALSKGAHIKSLKEYQDMYKKSIENPDAFWAEQAKELTWSKKWTKVSKSNFAKGKTAWFLGGQLNVSENCLDRHVKTSRKNKTAIIWEGEDGETKIYSYQRLYREVCRMANVLKKLGVKKGDRVTLYLPMIPELPISMLACTRIGAVHNVVFGGFSAESLSERIGDSGTKVVITSDGGFRGGKIISLKLNVDNSLKNSPDVQKVIVVKRTNIAIEMKKGRDVFWDDLMADKDISDVCKPEKMDSEDPLFILYTSGSTGKPKGILHTTAGYLLYVQQTFKYIFDIKDDDVFWCTADIGWITGHSYFAYGPLVNGATQIMFEGVPTYPEPDRFWEIVEKHKVSIFYTAPTVIRAVAAFGDKWPKKHNMKSLRILGSVGEPINPEAWMWYYRVIGGERCPVLDTWWQTETGGILITPLPGAIPTKPGSASMPFFGVVPEIVTKEGKPAKVNEGGYLTINKPWPGMMRGIYKDPNRFRDTYFQRFPGKYFTGDGARIDKEGFYWLMGRVDDVINVSGHRIGTAEVESALVSHKTVAEAAVVGYPHKIKGQGIYAYITLNEGVISDDTLKTTLLKHVTKEIGPIAKPDAMHFTPGLPKTRSGKIMRRILRKIAAGETEALGDTSTLADPSVVENLVKNRQA